MDSADESPDFAPPECFSGEDQSFHLFAGAVAPIVPFWATLAFGSTGPIISHRRFGVNVPVSDYASVFLGSHVSWMFAPFCLASLVCFVAILLDWKRGRRWYLRLGVYGGAVLGMMFSVAIGLAMGEFGLPGSQFLPFLDVRISRAWLSPVVVAFFFGIYFLHRGLRRRHRHAPEVMWWILLGLPFLGLILRSFISVSLSVMIAPVLLFVIFPLFSAAPLVVLSYGLMSWHLIRTYEWTKPIHTSVGALVWLSGLGLTLQAAFRRSVQIYESLPMPESSKCYVASAAARGSRWLVGSDEHGATDQLRFLKALEILLVLTFPAFHRFLRKIYDFAGPRFARIIEKRVWLANFAYFSLKPAEFLARFALRLVGGDAPDLAKRLYRNF